MAIKSPKKKKKKTTSQTSPNKLTPQMIEAAKAIGDVTDKRYDYEIAAEVPISHRQLINWKKIPEFMVIVNKSLDETRQHIRLNAYKSLNRQAIAGNMPAVKEALDRTEGQVKQKIEHSGGLSVLLKEIEDESDRGLPKVKK